MTMFKYIKLVILAKFHSGRTLNAGLLLVAFFYIVAFVLLFT